MIQRLANVEKNVLGMTLFLLNEIVFFALLIIAFVDYHLTVISDPNASNSLHPGITAIYTVFLLSSSLTVWMADRSLSRRNNTGVILWLAATVVLGAVFLVGQGLEYADLLSQNITVNSSLFATTFFTLTGFHGLHVFIGLVMLMILSGYAIAGQFKGGHSSSMSAISLYWHFVDAVWIVIFSIIYLWAAGVVRL